MLTKFYDAAPICSASRAGFMTGRFPAEVGFVNYVSDHKGNAAVAGSWASQHPILLAVIVAASVALIVGGVAYYFLRKAGKGLIAAHQDKRYLTRTEAQPPEIST